MTKKKTRPARTSASTERPPVDSFKVFHLVVTLAPEFARQALTEADGDLGDLDCEAIAIQVHRLARAIARKL